ncbi:MAG: cyclase family protein [Nitrospirae bacterium]|nr:cyclase family protein [Nitrospirota bacterium]
MKIYDISVAISPDLPVWPGDPQVTIERVAKIEEGANSNVSRITMGVHTGTHVDAPYHFLNDGRTAEHLPLDVLTGPVYVLELPGVKVITSSELKNAAIPAGTLRLLIKTGNSGYWNDCGSTFQTGFAGIDADGAEFLVNNGVKLIGMDYLSIAPYKKSRPTHEVLLNAGVVIVEGLDLSEVPQGHYTLYCLPLRLAGSDGAPARAILVSDC